MSGTNSSIAETSYVTERFPTSIRTSQSTLSIRLGILKMRASCSTTVLSSFALLVSTIAAQAFTSLTTFADWQAARTCVQNCVTDELAVYGYMTLGCHQNNPASCLCGNAQSESTLMHNDIYSCALRSCSNTAEATSAAGIFDEW